MKKITPIILIIIALYHQTSFAQQGCTIIATGTSYFQDCDFNVSSSTNETSRTNAAILQAAGLICSAMDDSSCADPMGGVFCFFPFSRWSTSGCYIRYAQAPQFLEVCSDGTWIYSGFPFQGTWDVVCPTLINLASFTATPKAGTVILQWSTESEIDNAGFNLYRSESENGQYIKINASLIPTKGSSIQGASYEFVDTAVKNRKTYYYKLEDIDINGRSVTITGY